MAIRLIGDAYRRTRARRIDRDYGESSSWYNVGVESVTEFDLVRRRPAMFVGDTTNGSGPMNMLFECVANAFDQYLAGKCTRVHIRIDGDGTITVEDDGPGLSVHGGDALPPLARLLVERSHKPTVDGHKPHVHLAHGAAGLFVVNVLSERFELVTARDGVEAVAKYARGVAIEPIATVKTTRASGTKIRFRPDPQVFAHLRVPRTRLTRELEDLAFLAPGLTLTWAIQGDELARAGLVGLVAQQVVCAADDVAHHKETYETPNGPIDVEVAVAWRTGGYAATAKPVIDSFVNFARTREHGSHVDGLVAAVRHERGKEGIKGMVAAVAVVLADVKYGNPSRDRLVTPEARGAVAEATRTALAARR